MSKEEFLSIAEGYYAEFESLKEEPTLYVCLDTVQV